MAEPDNDRHDLTADEIAARRHYRELHKKRKNGRLPPLPGFDATAGDLRDWLTVALNPAPGWRVTEFLRHGRQKADWCVLTLTGPDGSRHAFDVGEQRSLSPAAVEMAIVVATDGLCRPDCKLPSERKDIGTGLVAFATVTANQSREAETRDWTAQTVDAAEPLTGHTFTADGRADAISAMLARPKFDLVAAREYADQSTIIKPRPTLLIDKETPDQWIRVGDFATFWRHILGVGIIGQLTIDGRLAAIGIKRHNLNGRNRERQPRRLCLYRIGTEHDL
jgi:hypothetical protein